MWRLLVWFKEQRRQPALKKQNSNPYSKQWKRQQYKDYMQIVAALDGISNQLNATNQRSDSNERKKRFREWLTIWLVFGTLLASFAADVVFYRQMSEMRNARDDGQYALIQSQRAWMSFASLTADIFLDPGRVPMGAQAVFEFRNDGNTPAFHVSCHTGKGHTIAELEAQSKTSAVQQVSIGPHEPLKCIYIPIDLQEVIDAWERKVPLFVMSRIEYNDAFPNTPRRFIEVCSPVEVVSDPTKPQEATHSKILIFIGAVHGPPCNDAN